MRLQARHGLGGSHTPPHELLGRGPTHTIIRGGPAVSTASSKAPSSALSATQSQGFADPPVPHGPLHFGRARGASGSLSYQRPWDASTVISNLGLIHPDTCELDPGTEAASDGH